MTSRRISVRWTGRVQRGSHDRKLARYGQISRITASNLRAGRKMPPDEAMQFALDKYDVALRRLALNND